MLLQTTQMAKWKQIQTLEGVTFLDSTVKTGVPIFAPTWAIVLGVKNGTITEDEYTLEYTRLMRQSYLDHTHAWLTMCRNPHVIVACYCPAGKFCHRHLLAKMFQSVCIKHNIDYRYGGEFT